MDAAFTSDDSTARNDESAEALFADTVTETISVLLAGTVTVEVLWAAAPMASTAAPKKKKACILGIRFD